MNTNTLFGIGATAAAVVLTATLGIAQSSQASGGSQADQQIGQQQRGGRGPGGRGMRMGSPGSGGRFGGPFAGLNLTEEQQKKIAELQRAGREQAAPVEQELQTTQRTLHRELFADTRDAAKISDLSAKAATLQKQLADLHVKTTTAVADVLTADQRATMRERERPAGGPGRGPGRRHH